MIENIFRKFSTEEIKCGDEKLLVITAGSKEYLARAVGEGPIYEFLGSSNENASHQPVYDLR